jgi:molybdate/tungstate transport system ATP-binding protein
MITLEGVTLQRGSFALREISLHVERGEYLFLLGPSGAGKTLLLETIAGIHGDAEGRVLIRGQDVSAEPPEQRRVALVYQDYALFPHLTVRENVAFGPRMRGADTGEAVDRLLDRFDLTPLADRYPDRLSGGERQRTALARALATGPDILLLDEPFSAVDPELRGRYVREMRDLQQEQGLTVLQVSHARDEAFTLATRVTVLDGGRILQTGTVEEVFRRPATREAARIAGIENLVEGMVIGAAGPEAEILLPGGARVRGRTDAPAGAAVTVCIPSAGIRLVPGGACARDGTAVVPGTVTALVPGEHLLLVEMDCGFPLSARVPRADPIARFLGVGDPVSACIPAGAVHVIPGGLE